MDAFDEIYTNFDVSVDETYLAQTGYPFDYPTRWLNDPSMNKRIAIRRLDVTPSSHVFTIYVQADVNEREEDEKGHEHTIYVRKFEPVTFTVTEYDNLNKVMDAICKQFEYTSNGKRGGLAYTYDNNTNDLTLKFVAANGFLVDFKIFNGSESILGNDLELFQFGRFLNQPDVRAAAAILNANDSEKVFHEVWNRDRLHFHASFSTSRRKFIGKRHDFYQTLTLLYPPPTNESSFYIRFTSNGIKNILLRYCEFDVQLCFIVNYKKTKVL